MLEDRTNPSSVITIVKGADAYEGVSNGSFILFAFRRHQPVDLGFTSRSAGGTATPGQDFQYITSYTTLARARPRRS